GARSSTDSGTRRRSVGMPGQHRTWAASSRRRRVWSAAACRRYGEPVDQTVFYATVSGLGFTLLGLGGVVADRHKEGFADPRRSAMAYVIALHFMLPAAMSLLSLVAPELPLVWRTVFTLMGLDR